MQAGEGRLVVGGANGVLQLWTVGHTPDTHTITLEKSMELDGGVFSCVFDSKLELVSGCVITSEEYLVIPLVLWSHRPLKVQVGLPVPVVPGRHSQYSCEL